MKAVTNPGFGLIMVLGLVSASGCRKEPEPEATPSEPSSAAAPASAPPPAVSAPPPAKSAEMAPGSVGSVLSEWLESSAYKFRVKDIRRCASSEDAGASYRLGVDVEVFSKYDELVVSARDVKLEAAGVILNADLAAKPASGCTALLQTRQMRHDQTASGTVVFTVPPEFDARKAKVTYQPTRWGGSPRVEFQIPPCFDACGAKQK